MRKFFLSFMVIFFALSFLCHASLAAQRVFTSPRASTLGVGADLGYEITSGFKSRVNLNGYKYDYESDLEDIEYDLEATLFTAGWLLDWHPFQGGLRISAGAYYNGNNIDGDANLKTEVSYKVGDKTYTTDDLGSLDGDMTFSPIAPYLGIGWGTSPPEKENWFLSLDFGVMYQGEADVDLKAKNVSDYVDKQQLQQNINQEESNIEDEMDNYRWYPVISIGLTYRF